VKEEIAAEYQSFKVDFVDVNQIHKIPIIGLMEPNDKSCTKAQLR